MTLDGNLQVAMLLAPRPVSTLPVPGAFALRVIPAIRILAQAAPFLVLFHASVIT